MCGSASSEMPLTLSTIHLGEGAPRSILGASALGHVADHADDGDDAGLRVATRHITVRFPRLATGLRHVHQHVGQRDRFACQGAAAKDVDALTAQEVKEVGHRLAQHLVGAHAGQLLHEAVPVHVAQLAVVDDDILGGALGDLIG